MNRLDQERRASRGANRPSLTLVATTRSARRRTDAGTYDLRLSFAELTLVYKSLQAAKTLEALPRQDELLNDTIQLVDQALNRAI